MTGNLNLFSSLDTSVKTDVTLGNNVQVTVFGKGTVDILTKQGESKYIPDIYHVEGLKHNLLSIGQLLQRQASKQPADSKSTNDKKLFVSFEDKARHKRKYKSHFS